MSSIEEIKSRLDIISVISSYIKVQKAGANYRAICPFHSEKSPSFFISPSKQIWHCFGSCSEGGDIFKFVMKIEGIEFKDALKILAEKAGVELKREDIKETSKKQKMYEISSLTSSFFEKQIESSEGKEVIKYLKNRGISDDSIKKWHIGYSPDSWNSLSDFLIGKGYKKEEIRDAGLGLNSEKGKFYDRFRGRIMFPIIDINSRIIGFGGRIFKNKKDSEAKYVNSPSTLIYDKSSVLYGLNNASIGIRKKDFCILVEGYMDVIMVSQAGFDNVVAASGTSLTSLQLKIIKRYTDNIYMAFDMDSAGNSATKKGIEIAQSMGFNIKIITMKKGLDPADIVKEDPKEWEKMVKDAKSIHDFYFETVLSKHDITTIEGKKSIAKELIPVIKAIPDKIEQNLWLKDLAGIIKVKEEIIIEELIKIKDESLSHTFEDEKEIKNLEKKDRKDILEEYLLSLFLKQPELSGFIGKEDFSFFSQKTIEIITTLKEDPGKIKTLKSEEISSIIMRSEIEEVDKVEEEVQRCFKEIKKDFFKKRLEEISTNIKRGEENNNEEEIEESKNQFNQLLKIFNEL